MERRLERIPEPREDGLQINEDRPFHERFWKIERWAWGLFAIILVGALAGFTGGGGFFSRATAILADGEVEYPRVARWESSDEITVTFTRQQEVHRLTLGSSFSRYFEVEAMQPEPAQTIVGKNSQVMEFQAEGGPPARVTLHLRPLHPGVVRFGVGLDGSRTKVTSVILP